MFSDCTSLTSIDLSNFYTGKVTNMSYMFANCSSLFYIDISKFISSSLPSSYDYFFNEIFDEEGTIILSNSISEKIIEYIPVRWKIIYDMAHN